MENWEAVSNANVVDDKVEAFSYIFMDLLDTCTPERAVRMYPIDTEWITPHIKNQIKARQLAFTRGDETNYRLLCCKVSRLISDAKVKFYE